MSLPIDRDNSAGRPLRGPQEAVRVLAVIPAVASREQPVEHSPAHSILEEQWAAPAQPQREGGASGGEPQTRSAAPSSPQPPEAPVHPPASLALFFETETVTAGLSTEGDSSRRWYVDTVDPLALAGVLPWGPPPGLEAVEEPIAEPILEPPATKIRATPQVARKHPESLRSTEMRGVSSRAPSEGLRERPADGARGGGSSSAESSESRLRIDPPTSKFGPVHRGENASRGTASDRLYEIHGAISPYAGVIVTLALVFSAGLLYWLVLGTSRESVSYPPSRLGSSQGKRDLWRSEASTGPQGTAEHRARLAAQSSLNSSAFSLNGSFEAALPDEAMVGTPPEWEPSSGYDAGAALEIATAVSSFSPVSSVSLAGEGTTSVANSTLPGEASMATEAPYPQTPHRQYEFTHRDSPDVASSATSQTRK